MTLAPIAEVAYYTHEGPGTGGSDTDNLLVTYTNENGEQVTIDKSHYAFTAYSPNVTFHAHPIDDIDPYEDDIAEIDVIYSPLLQPLYGKGFHESVWIGNNSPEAHLTYTLDLLSPPSSSSSNGSNGLTGDPGKVLGNVPGIGNLPIPDWLKNNASHTVDWLQNQYSSYVSARKEFMSSDWIPDFLKPENMYLGTQYYGEKFGSLIGGYWGGKAGRFVGDVVGGIGAGIVGLVEGVGSGIGYAVATGNPVAIADEAFYQGSQLVDTVVNTGTSITNFGRKALASAILGHNYLSDKDINSIIDSAGTIASFAVPIKAGKAVKVKDVSITNIESLGANPVYKKVTYGVGLYIKNKPIVSIVKDNGLKIKTGGVPYTGVKPGEIYTAIDEHQIPHFRETLKQGGVDTTRFDSGLKIAKTTYNSKQGVFHPTTFEIHSKNIPDIAKPIVIDAMKEYAKKHGDVEVYGSNVQKMQIRHYQTREVGDMEVAVQHPKKFVEILDKKLKKAGITDYKIKNPDSDSPKVYFGDNKGIEIFKHDNTPMANIKSALKQQHESDFPYGFKSLPNEKIDDFKIMQLPEQHARKFSGGHVLRVNDKGQFDLLPTHEGRYKDITDFVDIAVAYYHEKGIVNAEDIVNYVKSTPDYIANKVSSPIFHYIRNTGKIPSVEEIKKMTESQKNNIKLKSSTYPSKTTMDINTNLKPKNNPENTLTKSGEEINKIINPYNNINRELLFKITKDDVSSTSLKKVKGFVSKIDANDISSIGSLTSVSTSVPSINIPPVPIINTSQSNNKNKNKRDNTSQSTNRNTSNKKDDTSQSTNTNTSNKNEDTSQSTNRNKSKKKKNTFPPIPPETDEQPYPIIIPPPKIKKTPPKKGNPPHSTTSTPPNITQNPITTTFTVPITISFTDSFIIKRHTMKKMGTSKKKKKKNEELLKLPIKKHPPGSKENKRTWFLRDLLNPTKEFNDMEETIKKIKINIPKI